MVTLLGEEIPAVTLIPFLLKQTTTTSPPRQANTPRRRATSPEGNAVPRTQRHPNATLASDPSRESIMIRRRSDFQRKRRC